MKTSNKLLAELSADSLFFFGHGTADDPQSAIGQLVRKVRDYPFVMVVGRSGSGKSSLVYAGLVPALRRARQVLECPNLSAGK